MRLVGRFTRQIVAAGFEEGAPDSISIEDACILSSSSVALALAGSESQLGIATLSKVRLYVIANGHTDNSCNIVPYRRALSSFYYRFNLMKPKEFARLRPLALAQ